MAAGHVNENVLFEVDQSVTCQSSNWSNIMWNIMWNIIWKRNVKRYVERYVKGSVKRYVKLG